MFYIRFLPSEEIQQVYNLFLCGRLHNTAAAAATAIYLHAFSLSVFLKTITLRFRYKCLHLGLGEQCRRPPIARQ